MIEKHVWVPVKDWSKEMKVGYTYKVVGCDNCGKTHIGLIVRKHVNSILKVTLYEMIPDIGHIHDGFTAVAEGRLFRLETGLDVVEKIASEQPVGVR